MLARWPTLARPYFRRRCRLNPHSSIQMIFLTSEGASPRYLRAYSLRASTVDGQFLLMGIVRSNLTVKPPLVSAFEMVTGVTDIALSLKGLAGSCPRVKSGRASSHSEGDVIMEGVILQFREPPRGEDAVVPAVSCMRSIA